MITLSDPYPANVGGDTMTDRKNTASIICCVVITLTAVIGVHCLLKYFLENSHVIQEYHSDSAQGYPNPEVTAEIDILLGDSTERQPTKYTYTEPTQATTKRTTGKSKGWSKGEDWEKKPLGAGSIELILFVADVALIGAGIFGYVLYKLSRTRYARDMQSLFALYAVYFIVSAFAVFGTYTYCRHEDSKESAEPKCYLFNAPIIYLYDDQSRDVSVKLYHPGTLTHTYPSYEPEQGWTVKASPDGTLTDSNGRQYEYLFWEADASIPIDLSTGFCVKGEDTTVFLEKALSDLGLSDTEANTFIMYWLPQLESNPYNVISFQTINYQDAFVLDVSPVPDTVIRINMAFYGTDEYVEMEPQDLASMNPSLEEREGLVLVEWGGENIA